MKKLSSLLAAVVCSISLEARTDAKTFDGAIYDMSRVMGNVFSTVKDKHYDPANVRSAMSKALQSLMKSLDSHSDFMDETAYRSIMETTAGSFFGIGVVIDNLKDPELEYLKVIDVQPGGPADQAGIRANDKIIEVDGDTLRGLTVEECRNKIKGPRNTTVTIKLLREGNPEVMTFSIQRDVVNEQNASCFYFNDPNIYYLSLNVFTDNSTKQVRNLLSRCQEKPSRGIIIDLRNNTGGLLTAAIDIAGDILDRGSLVVTTRDREGKVVESYSTNHDPLKLPQTPIFILVNNFTASAAEILAGCLKAHSHTGKQKTNSNHVFIVGTTTFGKGSVQEVIPVGEDCAVRLTTALYYLPDDYCVQQRGIVPDFVIPLRILPPTDMKWFTEQFGQERSLKNSIALDTAPQKDEQRKQPSEETTSWQERREAALGSDYQILSTVRLVNTYHLIQPTQRSATRQKMVDALQHMYGTEDKIIMQEITF